MNFWILQWRDLLFRLETSVGSSPPAALHQSSVLSNAPLFFLVGADAAWERAKILLDLINDSRTIKPSEPPQSCLLSVSLQAHWNLESKLKKLVTLRESGGSTQSCDIIFHKIASHAEFCILIGAMR